MQKGDLLWPPGPSLRVTKWRVTRRMIRMLGMLGALRLTQRRLVVDTNGSNAEAEGQLRLA